jgi:hypothetical protein
MDSLTGICAKSLMRSIVNALCHLSEKALMRIGADEPVLD